MPMFLKDRTIIAGDFKPSADDTYDLGEVSTPRAWKDGYFDGTIYVDNMAEFGAGQGITLDGVLLKDSKLLGTLTIPSATDTLALLAATQTLGGKTLTTPIIASLYQVSGGGLITVPANASAQTLVTDISSVTMTNKTLTSPTIQGTVAAGTGLTLPAHSSGDISLGASLLKSTNLALMEGTSTNFYIRNAANSAYRSITGDIFTFGHLSGKDNTSYLNTKAEDDSEIIIRAYDTGVDHVEVGRIQSAADPYMQATLPLVLLPIATGSLPGAPVEGMIAYDATLNKLVVYNGAAWETVTSA